MKIALIGVSHPFRGGIAHYTTALNQALNKKHQSLLFGLTRQYPEFLFPGKTQKDSSQATFKTENYQPCIDSINPLTWWQCYRDIKKFKPDFVLFTWWHPFFSPCYTFLSLILAHRAKIPCYYLCHNVLPHEPSILDKVLTTAAFNSSNGFIVHAQQQAKQLSTITKKPILVNPHPNYDCFVDPKAYTYQQARKLLNLKHQKVLLFFGLIRHYKGLKYLLKAILNLHEDYHLLLVGEFYESASIYQADLDQLKQQGKLTLINRYVPNEEVGLYFKAADLFIAPYIDATQSGVIQIAYSFNLPVIATRVGGLPEVVTEGKTGFLVEPKNSASLTAGINKFFQFNDPGYFKKNIQTDQYRFSWEHMVDTIERLQQQPNNTLK